VPARIRAALLLADLDALAAWGGEALGRVKAAAPDAAREIARASASDWLPVEASSALLAAVASVLGPEAPREVGRRAAGRALENGLYRAVLATARGLSGNRPERMLRFLPLGWDVGFSGCGRLSARLAPELALHLDAAPPAALEPLHLAAVGGALEAVVGACGIAGSLGPPEPTAAGATFALSRARS
jgi:hypothetical protein